MNATGQHGTRAADALRIIDDEGLSVRDVADWLGSGTTVREAARLRRLAHDRRTATVDEPLTVDEHAQPRRWAWTGSMYLDRSGDGGGGPVEIGAHARE